MKIVSPCCARWEDLCISLLLPRGDELCCSSAGAHAWCHSLSQDGWSHVYFNLILRLCWNWRVNKDYMWLKIFLHQMAFQWKVKCFTRSSRMFTRICLQFVGSSSAVAQLEILIKYQCTSIYFSTFLGCIFQQGWLTKSYLCEKVDKISIFWRCFYFCLACSDNFFKPRKISLSFLTSNMI